MPSPFHGFPPEALQFFRSLARNNNREWFLPRKPLFEEKVKEPMRQLVDALNVALHDFAPEYETDPGKAIFRIYRDVRFSKDKKPYKEQIAATFRRGGAPHHQGGYYFAISHKSVAVGGGVYMPGPETLQAIRHHLAGHHAEFRKLIRAKAVRELYGEMQGEQLTRLPKGFAADDPAADLVRYKQFLFYVELPADLAISTALYGEIVKRFKAITPFLRFLNAPIQVQRKPMHPEF